MKAHPLLACVAVGMTALSILGCSSQPPEPPPPAFVPGAQEAKNELDYPAGPYGVGKGSTIADLSFIGYVNAVADTSTMQVLSFGDYYNPHGRDATYQPASPDQDDRLFPKGSQYGEGKMKPSVLSVTVASVWCPPCNLEAKCPTPARQTLYAPCGGGLFLQLQDGLTHNVPATPKDLHNWTVKSYQEDFPTAIDPEGRLMSSIAAQQAFPLNFIVDTTTMKVVEVIAGVPDEAYFAKFEALLPDPSCPSKQPKCQADSDCPSGTFCSTSCPAQAIACIQNACQKAGCSNQ